MSGTLKSPITAVFMSISPFMSLSIHVFESSYQSVHFSHSVLSNSLWSHERQHTRPLCPLPIPGVYSNSCPLSWWCHPTISSSVVPFSSCLQPFPASGSFLMSQLFASGGKVLEFQLQHQSFQWIFTALPVNIQDWFPLGSTGWISLPSKGSSI